MSSMWNLLAWKGMACIIKVTVYHTRTALNNMDFADDKGVGKAKQMANKKRVRGRETPLSFPVRSCKNQDEFSNCNCLLPSWLCPKICWLDCLIYYCRSHSYLTETLLVVPSLWCSWLMLKIKYKNVMVQIMCISRQGREEKASQRQQTLQMLPQ